MNDKPLYTVKPEVVITLCMEKIQGQSINQIKHFKRYIRKGDLNHLPTQLAYMYSDFYMNSHNSNGDVDEMNDIIKNLKLELSEEKVNYDELDDKYFNKVDDLNKTIRGLKDENKKLKKYESVIDKLHPDIRKLFNRGPSCFED